MRGVLKVRGGLRVVVAGCGQARAASEDVVDLARHVEGGEESAECAHVERGLGDRPGVRGVEDGVLRPEAGEEEWKAAESEHARGVGEIGKSTRLNSSHLGIS